MIPAAELLTFSEDFSMSYFEWSPELETGIPEIDEQHRKIVDYINQLAAARESHDSSAVSNVLDRLVDYTASHFALEENLMESSSYASFHTHKSGHDLFVQNVLANKAELESGADITKQLLSTLKSWLMYHIKYDDANYVADVKRHLAEKSQRESGWFSRLAHRFFK
jgi:hemerythrin